MKSLFQAFTRTIESFPRRMAAVEMETHWTYDDLGQRVFQLSETLKQMGFCSGDRALLWMENSAEYIASYMAVLALGGVVVALHPQSLPSEVKRIVEDVRAAGLITFPDRWQISREVLSAAGLNFVITNGVGKKLGGKVSDEKAPPELAQIIFTSGTTGKPKGVMLSHGNLMSNSQSILSYLNLGWNDSTIALLPFVFAYGNSVMLTHLLAGGKIVIENSLAYPKAVVDWMEREKVSGFSGVASTYALLLRQSKFSREYLPHLRYLTCAGGPMPQALVNKLKTAFPTQDVIVMYGQTEASARLTYLPPEDLQRKNGSAGLPIPGVSIRILKENGTMALPREPGEILAAGANIMRGYWHDPENSARAFHGGWLRTGDLGYQDEDGYLYITGRSSEMIKSGAYRISPIEIEDVLYSHEKVQEAAALGVADPILGEAIVGLVVPKSGYALAGMEVAAHCAINLPAFKCPKVIHVIQELPKSPNGKVLRQSLRQLCQQLSQANSRATDLPNC
jgi:acyl-CoA synthetase (AMP-forming)/AMP-acid ligase II